MRSREQFEAWYLENWGHTEDHHETLFELSPDDESEYYRLGVRMAHQAWQAGTSVMEAKCAALAAENAAEQEPVVYQCRMYDPMHDEWLDWENCTQLTFDKLLEELDAPGVNVRKLYTAPPAPVVTDSGREQFEEWFRFHHGEEGSFVTLHRANSGANYRDEFVDLAWIAWKDSRASMLQGAEPVQEQHESAGSACKCRSSEKVQELQAGWVAVPVEPTAEMIEATFAGEMELQSVQHQMRNRERRAHYYRAMLSAAPDIREIPDSSTSNCRENAETSTNGWIPCSERMPEEIGRYWCYVEEQNSLGKSHYQWNCSWNGELWGGEMMYGRVTHWMPLQEPPKQTSES